MSGISSGGGPGGSSGSSGSSYSISSALGSASTLAFQPPLMLSGRYSRKGSKSSKSELFLLCTTRYTPTGISSSFTVYPSSVFSSALATQTFSSPRISSRSRSLSVSFSTTASTCAAFRLFSSRSPTFPASASCSSNTRLLFSTLPRPTRYSVASMPLAFSVSVTLPLSTAGSISAAAAAGIRDTASTSASSTAVSFILLFISLILSFKMAVISYSLVSSVSCCRRTSPRSAGSAAWAPPPPASPPARRSGWRPL